MGTGNKRMLAGLKRYIILEEKIPRNSRPWMERAKVYRWTKGADYKRRLIFPHGEEGHVGAITIFKGLFHSSESEKWRDDNLAY